MAPGRAFCDKGTHLFFTLPWCCFFHLGDILLHPLTMQMKICIYENFSNTKKRTWLSFAFSVKKVTNIFENPNLDKTT
jgi:hypothetical protein